MASSVESRSVFSLCPDDEVVRGLVEVDPALQAPCSHPAPCSLPAPCNQPAAPVGLYRAPAS